MYKIVFSSIYIRCSFNAIEIKQRKRRHFVYKYKICHTKFMRCVFAMLVSMVLSSKNLLKYFIAFSIYICNGGLSCFCYTKNCYATAHTHS